ncbi:MAG: chaplin family protein [Actinomadura sp.]
MRSWMKNAGRVALVTAGLFAIGSGIASADSTDGSNGVLSGNQVNTATSVPVNVAGNAAAVAGQASGSSTGRGAQVANAGDLATRTTSGRNGVLSGNQVNSPISAPINACGNALAVHGSAKANCADTTPSTSRSFTTGAIAPTSITAPANKAPGTTGTLTKLVPAAAGTMAPNAGPIGAQDLLVFERLTAARQSVGTVAGG